MKAANEKEIAEQTANITQGNTNEQLDNQTQQRQTPSTRHALN